jgi:hypothetical protein
MRVSVTSRAVAFSLATAAAAFLLAGCGGGADSGDVNPASPQPPATPALSVPNSFLLFPNPLVEADGSYQTNTIAYAEAYYAAIDPTGVKDTLTKWKAANGFDSGLGTQVTVVFGDVRDLGYGRRMTARQNPDGTIAVMVDNFLVEPAAGYNYTTLNLDAAVLEDRRWHIGTSTLEFSPGPGGGTPFVKFFNFDPSTGERTLAVDLDGRGEKAMPGPCISCHGGRADPLTPPDAGGNRLFPLLANGAAIMRGDVLGRMQPLEVDYLDFHSLPGFTRLDQEPALKTINRMVLCSYPIAAPSPSPEDACRRAANVNEWRGTAAALIKSAYGGDGLPSPAYADNFMPSTYAAGQTALYRSVVAPYCRACHLVRGTGLQSDIDLDTLPKFQGQADWTRIHVLDLGDMPLAKIVYEDFWKDATSVNLLAAYLEGLGFAVRDAGGNVLRPGRPIAIAGPDRAVTPGATLLSATQSRFADGYRWRIVSGPAGATLSNANSAQPTFSASTDGTYLVELIASGNGVDSAPARVNIVVNSALTPAPTALRFADVKAILQGAAGCANAGCHSTGAPAPSIFTNIDRNGDAVAGDATDDLWFYTQLRGQVNFLDIEASPLLRKPSGAHHAGGLRPGFDTSVAVGNVNRSRYDLIANWILNGAPQ